MPKWLKIVNGREVECKRPKWNTKKGRKERKRSKKGKPPKRKRPYQPRSFKRCLKHLGFQSYQEYLQSDLWKSIRERVLVRDNRICKACNAQANTVHHLIYNFKVLSGEFDDALVALCIDCHKRIEFDRNDKKRDLKHANQVLKSLLGNKRKRFLSAREIESQLLGEHL
jgi:hypothetical protein